MLHNYVNIDANIKLKDYIDGKSNKELQTPLHKAAMFGAKNVAECLISEYGVNKEAMDYKNRTPLYIAAEYSKNNITILNSNELKK
jgi:ankyrin repeat protein